MVNGDDGGAGDDDDDDDDDHRHSSQSHESLPEADLWCLAAFIH